MNIYQRDNRKNYVWGDRWNFEFYEPYSLIEQESANLIYTGEKNV